MLPPDRNVHTRVPLFVLGKRVQILLQKVSEDVCVASERIQVEQSRACLGHLAPKLSLDVISVTLENLLEDRVVTTVHSVLNRSHLLLRLRHALKIEVGAIVSKHLE